MQSLTFACPQCTRRMGVGLEWMGKSVRCPHCRQVVVAPTATPSKTAFASPLADAPPATDPSDAFDVPLPRFAPPPREGAESIFGEEAASDDSVFATPTAPKPVLLPDVAEPSPRSSGLIDFGGADEPRILQPTDAIPPSELPRSAIDSPEPFVKKDLSQPDFALLAKTEPTPATPPPPARADEVVDPFTKFGRMNATAPPAPRPSAARPPLVRPDRRSRYFWPLVAYAVAVTLVAAAGWLRPAPHPFAAIPDFFGQYHAADRKKVSALPVDLNRPFPNELTVKLGGKLLVGDLEFEPLAIEERRTRWEVKGDGGRARDIECLVLTARITNRSTRPFHPFDPAFNRYAAPNDPAPLTAVVVGEDTFPGGPIPWPFVHGGREFIRGQEADESPLEPGQQRTTTLPAIDGEKGKRLLARLKASKAPALWRVHVRRGFTTYAGETVPVSALVGVEFDASQIKKAGPS
ncbi:MAG: hypothetical protein JNK93_10375 [Planctomycetia bacterium]|nr:hypothetical protein [Planctomycetia bacterium]